MPRRLTSVSVAAVALTSLALSACSMPGESNNKNTASPGDKTFTVNNHKVNVPTGFTLYADNHSGTTQTVVLVDSKKMPTNINVAKNPDDFKVDKWCSDMETMFKKNFAPDADIKMTTSPKTGDKTECQIVGRGKTAVQGTTAKNPVAKSDTTKTDSTSPASTNASASASNSASTIPPGTPFAIMASVKRAHNGAYIALMSRQMDNKYSFKTEQNLFNEISK